jgi:hypothetical protein
MKRPPSRTTRSDHRDSRARQALQRLTEALDDSAMARRIDEPINLALERYLAAHEMPSERREFLAATADLVRVLCRAESGGQTDLCPDAAKDEAVYLMETQYRGKYIDGFEGALMDAGQKERLNPADVWRELASIVKARRRARYLAYVKARFLDALEWDTRLAIAEILMARCRQSLPEPLRSLPIELAADEILDLLASDWTSDAQLEQVVRGPWSPQTDGPREG